MKKVLLGCCVLILAASCGGGKKRNDPFETLTKQIDSLTVVNDTLQGDSLVVEDVVPATADESFADFFYNFASDERFQRSRVKFPISLYKGDRVERMSKDEWVYDPLFSRDPVYTVLFDKEEDMEMEKDTAVHSVQVDWIYLKDRKVKRYYFERVSDCWYLEAVNKEKLASSSEGREDFFDFYAHFANDSVFQRERLHDPLGFVTVDPEDEFQILETTLDEGQWFSFRPPLLKERLTNVHYGQKEVADTDRKIIEFKGFGNGFSNTLYFEYRNGKWMLMKFEDLSD
ncbi:DUF4348 domain-containing protein [Phocaeicola sp.]|uniref:DUF4348 domain-containing protein n=1 Tax=Phocaeicola sp. TaxID=2773926 RepID=UPI003AB565FD